jgi:hypothetical protein
VSRVQAGYHRATSASAGPWGTEQKARPLGRRNAQDRPDDGGLDHTGTAGHDQHLGHEREPDRRYLAFSKDDPDPLLDPRQCLVGIDPGPGEGAVRKLRQPFGAELKPTELRDSDEIERTVAAFAREPNGGLIVPLSGLAIGHRDLIVTLAASIACCLSSVATTLRAAA